VTELVLPDNPKIRLFAVTLASNGHEATRYAGDFMGEEVRPLTVQEWYSGHNRQVRDSAEDSAP
jgi:hypothetical protein